MTTVQLTPISGMRDARKFSNRSMARSYADAHVRANAQHTCKIIQLPGSPLLYVATFNQYGHCTGVIK